MKTVIIIPAKANSERLPNKNALKIGRLTLTELAVLRSMEILYEIAVISDDHYKVLPTFINYIPDDIVLVNEPEELLKERAWKVVLYAAERVEADNIIVTLPTSPFCISKDIDNAFNMFLDNGMKSPVMSVTRYTDNPYLHMFLWHTGMLDSFHGNKTWGWKHRVEYSQGNYWKSNGAVYVVSTKQLKKEEEWYVRGMRGYEMPVERSVDINTEMDYLLARAMYGKNSPNKSED